MGDTPILLEEAVRSFSRFTARDLSDLRRAYADVWVERRPDVQAVTSGIDPLAYLGRWQLARRPAQIQWFPGPVAELPRWMPHISPDLVTLAIEDDAEPTGEP